MVKNVFKDLISTQWHQLCKMATRNSAKMSAEIKNYLDDAIKNLLTKSDIDSLKSFIEEQSALIKNLTEKISTLEKKLNASEASTEKSNLKFY